MSFYFLIGIFHSFFLMRITILLFFLFSTVAAKAQNYIELVWSDEFDVNGAPNPVNWGYDLGANGWGNNEIQNYTSSSNNVRVENGFLIIEAKKDGSGNWTSGRVKSQGKKNFTYGKIVFRAKLPDGIGTWPALWMLAESVTSVNWPDCGEIDIMEHVGKNRTVVQAALHSRSSFGNTVNHGSTIVPTFDTQFHTYEALWTPEKIQFLVDGIPYYTYQPSSKTDATWPFKTPFFLIMNIAIGGNFGGPFVDPALSFARMEVDYVRVYQDFSTLALNGPGIVEENQSGLTFSTNQIQDATYEWTVPADAQITSGAGTSSITVKWGESEGNVSVAVNFNSQTLEKTIPVVHVYKPQLPVFSLKSDYNLTWQVSDTDVANSYELEQKDGALRVNYDIGKVVSVPALVAIPDRPMDLTDHPVLRVRAKSKNKSRSLLMRMDWMDEASRTTNKSPVFNFTPLIDDGEYYDYKFNFETANQWKSTTADVNEARITRLNFYIDFGTFGVVDADSLWIENIWIEEPGNESQIPNRPSHLSGALAQGDLELSWRDNSATETGFQIFSSTSRNGTYTQSDAVAANVTTFTGSTDLFYRVRSFNAQGESTFSNIFTAEDIVTSIHDEELSGVQLFPNPAQRTISIQVSGLQVKQLTVVSAHGLTVLDKNLAGKPSPTVDVSTLTPGVYFAQITLTNNVRVIRKLLIESHE